MVHAEQHNVPTCTTHESETHLKRQVRWSRQITLSVQFVHQNNRRAPFSFSLQWFYKTTQGRRCCHGRNTYPTKPKVVFFSSYIGKQSRLAVNTPTPKNLKAAMIWSPNSSQFIFVTGSRGPNIFYTNKETGLSAHILTHNYNVKSLPLNSSHQQIPPFWQGCVTSGTEGPPLCCQLWNSLRPHLTSFSACPSNQQRFR